MPPYIDVLFLVASLTLGFGVSLATYRIFAERNNWPMGKVHTQRALVPAMFGGFAIVIALLFAGARAYHTFYGGLVILLCGAAWAFFWTGFMRVGSQISLFLAPFGALVLMMAWAFARTPPGYASKNGFVPYTYIARVPLPERAPQRVPTNLYLVQDTLAAYD